MEYHKDLGLRERFKELCDKKGIKPFSLASKGVNRNIIDSIMRGSEPGVSAAHEIAKALNITIEELLTGEETQIKESIAEYGYTKEEKEYIDRLVKIMRTKMDGTVLAIKQNIDAFLTTPDKQEEVKKISNAA